MRFVCLHYTIHIRVKSFSQQDKWHALIVFNLSTQFHLHVIYSTYNLLPFLLMLSLKGLFLTCTESSALRVQFYVSVMDGSRHVFQICFLQRGYIHTYFVLLKRGLRNFKKSIIFLE